MYRLEVALARVPPGRNRSLEQRRGVAPGRGSLVHRRRPGARLTVVEDLVIEEVSELVEEPERGSSTDAGDAQCSIVFTHAKSGMRPLRLIVAVATTGTGDRFGPEARAAWMRSQVHVAAQLQRTTLVARRHLPTNAGAVSLRANIQGCGVVPSVNNRL